VAALDPRESVRLLTTTVLETTEQLDALGGQPFDATAARGALPRPEAWALPDELPGPVLRAITFAAAISAAAAAGIDGPQDGPDGWTQQRRLDLLRALHRSGERALVDATNAGVSAVAQRRTSR